MKSLTFSKYLEPLCVGDEVYFIAWKRKDISFHPYYRITSIPEYGAYVEWMNYTYSYLVVLTHVHWMEIRRIYLPL